MKNKIVDGYMYAFFENNSPLYLGKNGLLDIVKSVPNFEINSTNCEEFYDSLELFINNNSDYIRTFLIINTDNIDLSIQNKLVGLVKDRTYKTLDLPNNCKVIVIGNPDNMNKELFGLLTVL